MATANTTKSTVKKATIVAGKEVVKVEPIKEVKEVKIEEVKSPVSAKEKVYAATDEIPCKSITVGKLILIGKKTENMYIWNGYGDVTAVEYQDLKAAKLVKSQYIYSPLFIIDDEELLKTKEWQGVNEEVYSKLYSPEDIQEAFNLDLGNFKRILAEAPNGLKNTFRSIAMSKIEDGSLDSINKIKIVDEVLGTDLMNSYVANN